MKNTKLIGIKMRTEKKGDKEVQILETKLVDNPSVCKECKVNRRKSGSARCTDCTILYKSGKLKDARFQQKVEEARQNN